MYHDLIKRSLPSTTVSCHCPPKRKLPNLHQFATDAQNFPSFHDSTRPQIPDSACWRFFLIRLDHTKRQSTKNLAREKQLQRVLDGPLWGSNQNASLCYKLPNFFWCVFFPNSSSSEPLKKVLNLPIFWGTEVVSLPPESEKPVNQHITNPKSNFEPGKWRGCNTWTTWFTVLSGHGIHEDTQHDQPSPNIFRQ